MKKIILFMAVCLCFIGRASAQWVVSDPGNLAQGIINTTKQIVQTLSLIHIFFCGGLLAVFVVFIVLFMAGVNQWLCIGFIVSASLLLVWQTFRLNARYGTHGLMKAAARKRHPSECLWQ